VDRGQVILKGLSAPVRVLQIAPEGELPDELPPLQPILVTHPTNLPDDPTPFIGREREIAAVAALLQGPHTRLVTLTGPGGTGKTRLALQVGNTLLYAFRDGAFFCDLASLTDPSLVPFAIGEVLGVKEEPGKDLLETLGEGLREKHLLLVLDNFEHLPDAGQVVAQLLDHCRELHILVTSRIPLHLSREQEHAVPPLSVPDPTQIGDVAELSQYESVALFIQRAKAARDSFILTDENAPAVAEICGRLDGLPLAIELAAARIKLFPPQALLQRLSSRLKLLTGGARDRPTRQQTLRGAIDWSYSLLSDEEQALFARLSVFTGGCTLEAAEAVCNARGDLDIEVLDGVASLAEKSMVRTEDDSAGEPRFGMLATINEYALERLTIRGEIEAVRSWHAEYFAALVEQAETGLVSDQQASLQRLAPDSENLRAAVRSLEEHDMRRALLLGLVLWRFWGMRGDLGEVKRWRDDVRQWRHVLTAGERENVLANAAKITEESDAEQAIEWYDELDVLRGEADDKQVTVDSHALNAQKALESGDRSGAVSALEESLALLREVGGVPGLEDTIRRLIVIAQRVNRYPEASALAEEGLALAKRRRDNHDIAARLGDLGDVALLEGDTKRAQAFFEESMKLRRQIGDKTCLLHSLGGLGQVLLEGGDFCHAAELFEERLALARDVTHPGELACSLGLLARTRLAEGNQEQATVLYRAGLEAARGARDTQATVDCLRGIAAVAAAQLSAAAALPGSSMTTRAVLNRTAWHDQYLQIARGQIDEATWGRAWQEGQAMSLEEAVDYALEERA
jgi:predicted ATPase